MLFSFHDKGLGILSWSENKRKGGERCHKDKAFDQNPVPPLTSWTLHKPTRMLNINNSNNHFCSSSYCSKPVGLFIRVILLFSSSFFLNFLLSFLLPCIFNLCPGRVLIRTASSNLWWTCLTFLIPFNVVNPFDVIGSYLLTMFIFKMSIYWSLIVIVQRSPFNFLNTYAMFSDGGVLDASTIRILIQICLIRHFF